MREIKKKIYYLFHINYSVNKVYIFMYDRKRVFTTNQAWNFINNENNSDSVLHRETISFDKSIKEISANMENYISNVDNTKIVVLTTLTVSDENGNDIEMYSGAEKQYENKLNLLLDENFAYDYPGNTNVVDVNSFAEMEQYEKDNEIYEKILEQGAVRMKKKYDIVVLDLETTGFDKECDEILQVSLIDQDENVLLNEYCKPEVLTSWDGAEKVNGISPSMVKDKKPFKFFSRKIEEILNDTKKILIYNAKFDAEFLHEKGLKFPDDIISDVMIEFSEVYGEWNDYFQNFKWQKLGTAANYYGYKFKAHDSLEDVKATLYVYKCMHKEA